MHKLIKKNSHAFASLNIFHTQMVPGFALIVIASYFHVDIAHYY